MPQLVLAATEPHGALALVLTAVALLVGYWISLKIHPYIHCRHCSGGGKDRGEVFVRSFGLCRHCDGTGRTLRLGVRLFRTNRPR